MKHVIQNRMASVFCGASVFFAMGMAPLLAQTETNAPASPEIRTPQAPATPRINGAGIFGVRPGHPFFYHIPATGDRPMEYSVSDLPAGLKVDSKTGQMSGVLAENGEHVITLRAKNAKGSSEKKFKIVVGETIELTPALGWNSWNCWGRTVDADKVLKSAKAMVSSGLIDHGWSYINIDDGWQGERGGEFNGLQGNEKFPGIKALCDAIHAMGLKIGIYSTPWKSSYGLHLGGSADNPEGALEEGADDSIGKYSFAINDAKQWAAWGFDYLKYDWHPNRVPETREMYEALRASGRDIILSLSNTAPKAEAPELSKIANSWRTTGDIRDEWGSMSGKGFGQDNWAKFQSPGHWNDPDMLVVGYVGGWGGKPPRPTGLAPDEQYTHITLWAMVSAPMLIGCDMERLDDFTFNLLSNDEVLAVSQDSLGKQGTTVAKVGDSRVYAKDLEDGSKAVGLFNTGTAAATVTVKWSDLKISGKKSVRDLWRQKDLGAFTDKFELSIPPHGAELVKISP